MVWLLLLHLVGLVVDLVTVARSPECDKDLEILLLRHQLRLLQRQSPQPPRLRRWEKLTLVVLATRLARLTPGPRGRLNEFLFLFNIAVPFRLGGGGLALSPLSGDVCCRPSTRPN